VRNPKEWCMEKQFAKLDGLGEESDAPCIPEDIIFDEFLRYGSFSREEIRKEAKSRAKIQAVCNKYPNATIQVEDGRLRLYLGNQILGEAVVDETTTHATQLLHFSCSSQEFGILFLHLLIQHVSPFPMDMPLPVIGIPISAEILDCFDVQPVKLRIRNFF